MEDLMIPARVDYRDQPVLTTEQLAEFYGCDKMRLIKNFNNNRDRFTEGVHYFKLEGDALKEFKDSIRNLDIVGSRAPSLILWTKQGAFRHAKMLNTDRAWEVYELLEENYFNPQETLNAIAPPGAEAQNSATKNLPPHLADSKRLCVYAAAMADETVKIGKSNDFRRRANELRRETHLEILKAYRTGYLPSLIAAEIENTCLRAFDFCRTHGEFFNASFADVRAKVIERAIAVIEIDRALYVTKWPDANDEYDQFLSEIHPSAELAAAPELSLEKRLDVLLECARLTKSDARRENILSEILSISTSKKF